MNTAAATISRTAVQDLAGMFDVLARACEEDEIAARTAGDAETALRLHAKTFAYRTAANRVCAVLNASENACEQCGEAHVEQCEPMGRCQ